METATGTIGVVIVAFNSESVIRDCLHSLYQSRGPCLKVVIVDNASTDDTRDVIRHWASTISGFAEVSPIQAASASAEAADYLLVCATINAGFAAGVNIGLRHLRSQPDIDLFWILNPDIRVRSDAAECYARRAGEVGTFSLMGGRTLYINPKDTIQSDGGNLNAWTGMCANANLGRHASETCYPSAPQFDYIPGANIVVSRAFLDSAGLMDESYFLYYEEVDWAFRRGALSLTYAPGAIVEHHGGSAIGSPTLGKTQGTSFANYFNYRSRMRFMRRFYPWRLPVAYIYSVLKVVRLVMQGFYDEAHGAFRGLHALPPPANVRRRLTDEAARIAFED
jgi:GT2 family glycosyltransferase